MAKKVTNVYLDGDNLREVAFELGYTQRKGGRTGGDAPNLSRLLQVLDGVCAIQDAREKFIEWLTFWEMRADA